jgi:hypothetical protein
VKLHDPLNTCAAPPNIARGMAFSLDVIFIGTTLLAAPNDNSTTHC